jgi:hypothetical protein
MSKLLIFYILILHLLPYNFRFLRFQVLEIVTMSDTVLQGVMPCSVVYIYIY